MVFLALVSVIYFLGQELNKRYLINKEVRKLEADISQFESKNEELLKLLNYLKTTEYQERQARQLLKLQKPGEFAVALPLQPEETEDKTSQKTKEGNFSNLKQWWNYFFGPK